MSDNQLSKVTAGKNGFIQQVNQFVDALSVNFLPRTIAGSVVDLAGTLGETTRRWAGAFLQSLSIRGTTGELVFRENATSSNIEVKSNGTVIGEFNNNAYIPKTRVAVSNNAVFENGEFISSSATITNTPTVRTVTVRSGSIVNISFASKGTLVSVSGTKTVSPIDVPNLTLVSPSSGTMTFSIALAFGYSSFTTDITIFETY